MQSNEKFNKKGSLIEGMKLTAVIEKEGNLFIAYCPEIGTASQGISKKEALQNLQEATELYLEEFPDKKAATLTTFEVKQSVKA